MKIGLVIETLTHLALALTTSVAVALAVFLVFGVTAPFWFAFAGSAVFLVLIWPQLTHIAHDDDLAPSRVS